MLGIVLWSASGKDGFTLLQEKDGPKQKDASCLEMLLWHHMDHGCLQEYCTSERFLVCFVCLQTRAVLKDLWPKLDFYVKPQTKNWLVCMIHEGLDRWSFIFAITMNQTHMDLYLIGIVVICWLLYATLYNTVWEVLCGSKEPVYRRHVFDCLLKGDFPLGARWCIQSEAGYRNLKFISTA